jgi:predicted nuclease of predicted toxin-antitoxin system
MRVLLDTCVWHGVRDALIEAGHDVTWCGDWEFDPGDEVILARAAEQDRILVTLDKDFGTMAVHQGRPHAGILRLANLTTRQQIAVCVYVLETHGDDLRAGGIVTAESDRVRLRRRHP